MMPGNKKPVVLPTQPAMSGEMSILKPSVTEFIINHLTNKSMKFYTCFSHTYYRKWGKINRPMPLWAWLTDNGLCNLKRIAMRTNLVIFLIAVAMFRVTASVHAQTITLSFENAPIEKVFTAIEKQSGYIFWYDRAVVRATNRISIKIKNGNLSQTLDQCFKNQPLLYQIVEKTIVVKEKPKPTIQNPERSIPIKGKVVDERKQPLGGVNIRLKNSQTSTMSDEQGNFSIEVPDENAILSFTYVGLQSVEVTVKNNLNPTIILKEVAGDLEAVSIVNTGYQTIPKERATGSFVQIDNELLNRRVSTNLLDRLDGISSGLIFNKSLSNNGSNPRNETIGISIRGRSTIDSRVSADPLIVLDNFPYEGNLDNINPNDIESVTILKDAAAASIWGARSGNGVIVITTKKGKLGQPLKINFNTNVTVSQKPDLYYSHNYLSSQQYIEIEKYLFDQGSFNSNLNNTTTFPLISPVVEILAKKRAGTISASEADAQISSLSSLDIREQQSRYLLRNGLRQQYSVNLTGGSDKAAYNFSAGYDNNRNERYSGYTRLNLNASNTFNPLKGLEIMTSLQFSKGKEIRGSSFSPLYPYTQIANENGNALVVPLGYRASFTDNALALGFLDWKYRPLDEMKFVDYNITTDNMIIKSSVKYNILQGLDLNVQYQYENQKEIARNHQSIDSYYTRDLINRYSQRSSTGAFTYPLPKGGILTNGIDNLNSHNLRGQANYSTTIRQKHEINGLLGAEIRDINTIGNSNIIYGYDEDLGTATSNLNYGTTYPLNPIALGSQALPVSNENETGRTNRYISYYANAGYTYDGRYIFTISGRKDGANIFGARTNDKITPLWSTGIAWNLSREKFYHLGFIPSLKLRATYGYNGNVYNASSYLTATYATNSLNGNQMATITSPPNSELRWERVRNINLGLDFTLKGNVANGTIEFFQKYATDLIEDAPLAPSSGYVTYKGNAASLKTNGIDITLNSHNIRGTFNWYTTLLTSFQQDKVVHFDTKFNAVYLARFDQAVEPASNGIFPVIGNPLFGIYSFRSAGLDPVNGDPRGYLNGQVSKDYTSILNNTPIEDLVYHGTTRPNVFGALRNSFEYRGISLSFNITYKFDYYFRRKSINTNYTQLINSGQPNSDYATRWQKPGDELYTNVPSLVYAANANRNIFYRSSEVLVEKGDHIRLQDVAISYDLKNILKKGPLRSFQAYTYVNNLGILWRANKSGIDPDINDLSAGVMPAPKTIAFGIKGQF